MENESAAHMSNFTYFAVPHPEHYCILNTSDDAFLLDERLSPSAIYVMTVIRSLQSRKWHFSAEGLAKYTHRGIDMIQNALRQLRRYGYCRSTSVRIGGKYAAKTFSFFDIPQSSETPVPDEPLTEIPSADTPIMGKPLTVKPSAAKRTQPNIKSTFYRNKPKTESPKVPERDPGLDFDMEDIFEKPSAAWLKENRSG